ncbi:Dynein-1-beta heavy chain, flagellar inner arm I1 complex [Gossypium australe]|uniref:Dynein-1-beta heavy chain, flagellar inner arm I1 complex n=1 Tax=Gossypium australe TaxID=47621 RepID=A0A5B6UED3_9ROSI|nr:Dynein-1-beta heavy chain, flagellar inner arm I1 complex [Gossypium australe]
MLSLQSMHSFILDYDHRSPLFCAGGWRKIFLPESPRIVMDLNPKEIPNFTACKPACASAINGDEISEWMIDFDASHSLFAPFTTKPEEEIAFLESKATSKRMAVSVPCLCCLRLVLSASVSSLSLDLSNSAIKLWIFADSSLPVDFFLSCMALTERVVTIFFFNSTPRAGAVVNYSTQAQVLEVREKVPRDVPYTVPLLPKHSSKQGKDLVDLALLSLVET